MGSFDAVSKELTYIERENDVRIVFACESGSRAWGFESPDSDFDVRFVFVRPLSDYLMLNEQKDTIERPEIDRIDASGWDLRKFLRLLRDSNPSAIEWLGSPIVYREDSAFWKAKKLRETCFDPVSGAWHYYGMAKKHDLHYLKPDLVHVKKYLYIVRAILAAEWCLKRFSPAPMVFDDLNRAILPVELRPEVENLLDAKRTGDEKRLVAHSKPLDEWIFSHLDALPEEINLYRHHEKVEWAVLDEVFRLVAGF